MTSARFEPESDKIQQWADEEDGTHSGARCRAACCRPTYTTSRRPPRQLGDGRSSRGGRMAECRCGSSVLVDHRWRAENRAKDARVGIREDARHEEVVAGFGRELLRPPRERRER